MNRYYGVVQLIPIFQYSNMYVSTPKLRELAVNEEMKKDCIAYITKSGNKLIR